LPKRTEKRVRYFTADDYIGLTRSQLGRASKATQIEYMTAWFRTYFEDPAHEMPHITREGGYQYIWGGPYDAADELGSEFGGLIPDDRIEAAVNEVHSDGTFDWAPTSRHPNRQESEREYQFEEEVPVPTLDERLATIEQMLESGVRPTYGTAHERALRVTIIENINIFQALARKPKPGAYGKPGHNGPPVDDPELDEQLDEALKATEKLKDELARPEPEAPRISQSAKILRNVAKFIGAIIAGKVVEKAYEKASEGLPGLYTNLEPLISTVIQWLEFVTFPF